MTAVSKVLTIMFTDIKGFTERTSSQSREDLNKLLKKHEELISPIITKFGGKIIKTIGDAFMAVCESPTNAVLCAVLIQHKFREYNLKSAEEEKIQIRIALNAGEVQIHEKDVFGEAVNIAARIEGITEANEIYFTEAVYLAMNKSEVPSSEIGWRKLQGLPEAIKVYKVIQDENSEKYNSLIKKWQSGRYIVKDGVIISTSFRLPVYAIATGLILIVGAIVFWYLHGENDRRLQQVSEQIKKGRALGAIETLATLKDKDVNVNKFNKLLIQAVTKHVDYLSENLRYDDLDKFLIHIEEQYGTNLDLADLRIKHKFKQIQETFKTDFYKSFKLLSELLKRYPKNEEVLLQEALLNIRNDYGSTYRALNALSVLFEINKKYVDNETFKSFVKDFIKNYYPFDRSGELARKIIEDYYYDSFRSDLKSFVHDEKEYPRVNAYKILLDKKDITGQEEFNYHFYNTITSTSYSNLIADALAYFEKADKDGKLSELKKGIDVKKYGIFPVLKQYEGKHTQSARKIFVSYLMPELKDYFIQYVYDKENTQIRVNSFMVLEESSQTKEIDIFKYHQINLMNINPSFFETCVSEALEYMKGKLALKDADWQATIDVLQEARQKLSETIKAREANKMPPSFYAQGQNIIAEIDKIIGHKDKSGD